MKKLACFFVLLCMLLAVLTANAMAEGELKVFVHDALTMKYEVVGGSGQYEVVSTALCDYTGAVVSPSEFKDGSYYYATVIVRDLVTGETATGKQASLYRDPYYRSCERGEHYVETSESVGESPNYLVGTYYYDITETTHTILQKIAWHCDHCHAYVYTQELVNTREHYFDRSTGLCECGLQGAAACMHNQTAERKGSSWRIMVADNAEEHKLEQTYETYCVDCREVLSTSTETDWEDHTFNDKGYCVCGYYKVPECRHIRTAETFVGTSYTPSETDPGVHWAEPNYKVTCLDCGYVRNQTWEGMPEHHEFDENGRCICGYKQKPVECSHEKTDRRDIDTKYISIAGDTRNHTVEQVYETYCLACAQVLSTLQDSWAEAHQYNSDGLCTLCGYQIDPDAVTEPLKVSLAVWQKTAVINTSIGVTAIISGGSGNFRYQWSAASEQGKHAQSNSAKASWAITPASADAWQFSLTIHDLTTGEQVTAYSSYVTVLSECQHTGERKDYGKNHLLVTYDFDVDKDILRHLVIYNETPLWTCADCLQEIPGETKTSLNRKEFHIFDEGTNKCVCGANRIDNFDGRLSYKLREMVEENWDPYGKWTWSYEQWDDFYHNYSLYVSDRVIGTEYAQIVADIAATAWMAADYYDQLLYEETKLMKSILGLDTSNMTYESIVEKTRASVASESSYLAAGLTTKQIGTVANIISESVVYAQEQAIKEYYKLNDEWVDIVELIDEVANDEEIVVKGSEWLFKVINNFDGMSSAEIVEKYRKMVKVNEEVADGFSDGLDAFGVLVDLYNVTLQAATIHTFTKTHIEYMESALASTGRDQLPLRTTLQTLINETKDQYDDDWASNFNANLPQWIGSAEVYLDQYKNLAYEEVIDIGLDKAIESIPGVGLVTIGFSVLDMFTGDKTDDLLAYKKTYEIAEGSRDSLLSAIDALSDPLTQSQLDALKTKIVFYASSCQTLSNAYNGVIQYDAKKGLPISTSSYSREDFIAETSAYIDLFKRY